MSYVKRQTEHEAVQFDGMNDQDVIDFALECSSFDRGFERDGDDLVSTVWDAGLVHRITPGDYLVDGGTPAGQTPASERGWGVVTGSDFSRFYESA